MTIDDAVRTRVQELLKEQQTKIATVSLAGGLTPSTVYDFMRGTTQHIQLNTVKQLCMGFGITLAEFFDRAYFDDYE
ncbi:MAG: helix-turn-helix transcriptional regulator [Clostridia bacterium]|nr:helix-turn-helix transcriptional regulator [Clostridia bacterium]